jgi:sugar lactone lactonase YvrE
VSDTYNHRIQVLNRSLSAVTHTYGSYGTGQGNFYEPEGVIFDPGTSRLIVADRRNYRVVILDWDAVRNRLTFNRAFGAEGVAAGEFRSAYGVATGPLGRIHVADSLNQGLCNHRIQIFSGEGVFSREFGEFGATAGKFDRPLGVAVDASGLVYVADAANARIQCLSGSGGYLWQTGAYGTANGQFREPRDVRFGIRGRLYVTDTSNSRLQVFDLTTFASPRHLASYGEVGSEPGQLRFPQACAPALDDNVVYVADTRNHRVQALRTILDDDGDGMDDLWEDLNGLDSRDGDDADDDPDGDGLSNIGEYRLGTDPQDEDTNGNGVTDGREAAAGNDPAAPAIALRISAMEIAPDELSWQAHAGQAYRVMYGTSLTEPDWVEHGVVTSAVDGVYTWTNSVMPGDRMYFYRIDEVQE